MMISSISSSLALMELLLDELALITVFVDPSESCSILNLEYPPESELSMNSLLWLMFEMGFGGLNFSLSTGFASNKTISST